MHTSGTKMRLRSGDDALCLASFRSWVARGVEFAQPLTPQVQRRQNGEK